jgi:DNA-binding NarL/FixJ family response regulator
VRVAVLEDQILTRNGIVAALTDAGVEVVSAVTEVSDLIRSIALDSPDAAVVDVRLPPTFTDEGIRAAGQIRKEYPRTAVLVLSQYLEAEYATSLLESASGGVGYLLKDRVLEPSTLVDALRRTAAGECVIDPAIVADLFTARSIRGSEARLTERELEVLAAMAEGLTNLGIARRLGISDRTIEVHVQRVFTKLGIPNDMESNRRVLAALHHLRANP